MSADLLAMGFRILVVGASTAGGRQATSSFPSDISILLDPDRDVYRAYGFPRIAGVIQRSGTVVVNRDGTVSYLHRTTNPASSLNKTDLLDVVNRM